MTTSETIQAQLDVAVANCNQIRKLRAAGRKNDATFVKMHLTKLAADHAAIHGARNCQLCDWHHHGEK